MHIHTCRSYVHTPCKLDRHALESPTGTFIVVHMQADSSDFGLLGKRSSRKCETPCPGGRWTTVQNLTPLALSSPEKSVTVRTYTKITQKKQTANDISTPCLSAHVDNKVFFFADDISVIWHVRMNYSVQVIPTHPSHTDLNCQWINHTDECDAKRGWQGTSEHWVIISYHRRRNSRVHFTLNSRHLWSY